MRTFPTLALALFLPVAPLAAQSATSGLPPSAPAWLQLSPEAQVTASGLATLVLQPGRGTARPGPTDYVTAHYTLWTPEGKIIDNTRDKDGPMTLPVERVMKGMAEGLQLMTLGERRRLWVPAGMGFPEGKGLPTGRIIMELEVVAWDPSPNLPPPDLTTPPADAVTLSSGLIYRVLRKGTETEHPKRRDQVTVHYTGWTADGKMFESSVMTRNPATFRVSDVIDGWSQGLRLMAKGDKFRLWIPEKLAYQGEQGKPAGRLVFDVELLAFWH